jgi:hypothetical protein
MGLFDKLKGLAGNVPEVQPPMTLAPVGTRPAVRQIPAPPPTHPTTGWIRHNAPKASEDLARILNLPRRIPPTDLAQSEALIEMMTNRLRRDNPRCKCATLGRQCIKRLNFAQAWTLYEMGLQSGIVGIISVGHGKTALDILAAMVMPNCKKAVLLIPPGLREQLLREFELWREHFNVPSLVMGERGFVVPGAPIVHVVAYSMFSRPQSTELLGQLDPDTVIADEGHRLRYADTATTSRVLRYFSQKPQTRFCVWSGTLTARSIKDYSTLSAMALDRGSPLPLNPETVTEWAQAIDPSDWPAPPGDLLALCDKGEHLHRAFHRRLTETRGVISTTEASDIGASINLFERHPPEIPETVKEMLRDLRSSWTRPDGEEFVDVLQVKECAKQLACGFYYRWRFPKGEPEPLIRKWLAVRKAWHKELREKLKHRVEHLDSPLLATKAAIRFHSNYQGPLPIWESFVWPEWREIRDKVYHETEAVWVSDYLAQDAVTWAKRNKGIVWYEHTAFGRKVGDLAGLPVHGGGPDAEARILAETGKRSIVASIDSHGTGRDGLQRIFSKQLVANPPSGGAPWEQLLGRLHRQGQTADEVDTWVYRHTEEMRDAIDTAWKLASYIQTTMGTRMKVLNATVEWDK